MKAAAAATERIQSKVEEYIPAALLIQHVFPNTTYSVAFISFH